MFTDHEPRPCGAALPLASGGFVSLAWFIFFDALLVREASLPRVEAAHWVPGALSTVALFMALVAPYRPLVRSGDDVLFASTSGMSCARLWLFCTMLLSLSSIYAAVALYMVMGDESSYRFGSPDKANAALGSAVIGQTFFLSLSSTAWIAASLTRTR